MIRNQILRRFFLAAFLLCAAAQASHAHAAAPPSVQQMEYDVYAAGMHVVSADLRVDTRAKDRYALKMAAYTHGLLAKLAPWSGTFESAGWYDAKKKTARPKWHVSNTRWRDENEINEYRYGRDGSFKAFILRNDEKNGPQPVDDTLTQNTSDVLTATLNVMNAITHQGVCAGDTEIFDGARRFHLIFKDGKPARLQGNALNVYTGPAIECAVEVKPSGGKWHAKPRGWMSIQEQGRKQGTMPTVWFAVLTPGKPAVPVKIRVKTDYGTLFMHLNSYKYGAQSLSLPKK